MAGYTIIQSYVGGKAQYVSKIKALFDENCNTYVEPFLGSGALFFSMFCGKYQSEWVNEINDSLYGLYQALADDETREQTMKAIFEIEKPDNADEAKKQFNEARSSLSGNDKPYNALTNAERIERARNAYLIYSQSFNNSGTTGYSKVLSNEKYRNITKRNLQNAVERLKNVRITQCDAVEIINKVKGKRDVQLFLDPPYVGLYRRYSTLYKTEMASLIKHLKLVQELADAKAAVVLCGYRAPKGIPTIYDILGDGWHCFRLADTTIKCQVVAKGEAKGDAHEFVWTNRVPERVKYYLSMEDYKESFTMEEYWERIKKLCRNREVPEKHIKEYSKTYKLLYGRDLLDSNI